MADYSDEIGECDCGEQYELTSREDHNADTGQCWPCYEAEHGPMTDTEYDDYLEDN